ncbi:MAG: HlyD family type I secretion periplasmic adaptor subunit, partial [Gammaproteobacteria bacterium]|nr:HlyD family type I secretion periplasmic adaptor subunit [Gammaproteobacteria bacterium]
MKAGSASAPADQILLARRPLLLGFLGLLILAAGLVGWGTQATLSGAVIAVGQVEVETRDQVVEHIDGGTVGEILARDGDRVEGGDVLIRFDDTLLRSEEALLHGEQVDLMARRNRLEAEFPDMDGIAWHEEIAALAKHDPTGRAILDGQQRLFEARRTSRSGQVARLRERMGQIHKQIAGLEAQREATSRQRGFILQELDAQRSLSERGLTDLPELLALERQAAQLDGHAGDIEARIAEARGRIAETEIQILQIGTQRIEEAEGRAREVQARENQVREQLTGVRERLNRLEVRAPVAGEVVG